MDRHDELPDELRRIADRLREHRAEPTPLELDAMRQRIDPAAGRRSVGRLVAAWRTRVVAFVLSTCLAVSAASAGVAAATGGGGGYSGDWDGIKKLLEKYKDSSHSQYCKPYQHDGSDSDTKNDSDQNSDCDNSDSRDSDNNDKPHDSDNCRYNGKDHKHHRWDSD